MGGWVQRVRDVAAHGEGWEFDAEEMRGEGGELEPGVAGVAFVFVALYEVPAGDEVLGDVEDGGPAQGDGDVVPWHSAVFGLVEVVLVPVVHVLEIQDAVLELLEGREKSVLGRVGGGTLLKSCPGQISFRLPLGWRSERECWCVSQRPKQRSSPPTNASSWSITMNFS